MLQFNHKPLPPKAAKLCLQVHKFCQDLWPDKMLVAYSGGADSKALAIILHCLGKNFSLAHVDHGLRPESAAEMQAAKDFAASLQRDIYCTQVAVASLAKDQGLGLEEAGRQARQAFFKSLDFPLLLTGHHLDDLSEDVILRLLRGTGWPALGGLTSYDPKHKILRPLLYCRKSQILEFLQSINMDWIEDSSNNCLDFKRNRIRHQIIPQLTAESPQLSEHIQNLHYLANLDHRYWQAQLAPILQQIVTTPQGCYLPRSSLHNQPKALRLRLYLAIIQAWGGQGHMHNIMKLDQAVMDNVGNKIFQFQGLSLKINARGLWKLSLLVSPKNKGK